MNPTSAPAALDWTEDGAPRSTQFDDIYFQPGEGLDESRAVFLAGCDLPAAWRNRDRFVVGELGFGSGLNILALLDLWRSERTPGQRLHVFSVEAYPLDIADAARALSAWPQLSDLSKRLLEAWPGPARGVHRIDLPEWGVTIDVVVDDVANALDNWNGQADAWFLDGFSPAKNPQMWSDDVLRLVAQRSAPGARLGTFTVAGAVRRSLTEHGYVVSKHPGHGRKRQRLEGRFPGETSARRDPGRIVILGGGIAAACLARAASAEGLKVTVIAGPPGASANPAALVTPAFDVSERAGARLSAQAFRRATALYEREAASAIIGRGVLQLEQAERDVARFDALAQSALFSPEDLERLDPAAVAARLDEPVGAGGFCIRRGLTIDPVALVDLWLASAHRISARVAHIQRSEAVWRLTDDEGGEVALADTVWLAAGPGLRALAGLKLQIVRGQLSWTADIPSGPAAAWGGYAAPLRDGMLFGATHDRHDEAVDIRADDDRRNLQQLGQARPRLAQALSSSPLQARASLRAAAPDHQPAAGADPDREGLFILGALGGRGFTLAPLLADHIVALTLGYPSPLPADLAAGISPTRLI